MPDLPSGTVAFLFTDIEGSTRLWQQNPPAMQSAVAAQLGLIRGIVAKHGGTLYKAVGDGTQSAFPDAQHALAAAIDAQRALLAAPWGDQPGPLRVRMAIHAGQATPRDGDYLAAPLNRLARLVAVGHGGQILVSQAVQQLVRDDLPADAILLDLGAHRLRDLQEPELVFQVAAPGPPRTFPPLRGIPSHPTNLSEPPTRLVGRASEVAAVLDGLEGGARLVTLTGPGGTGKTRLALEVAAEALERFPDGVFLVDLAPLRDAADVLPAVASVLGVREAAGETVRDALGRFLASRRILLVLDNCEQVAAVAPDLGALLAACPQLALLATSREALRLRAEHVFQVPPLPVPEDGRLASLSELAAISSVALFVERAQAGDPAFVLTEENARAVGAICRRLDGLPLAIELAAARVRHFPPPVLLARLKRALPVLTGGPRDAPERQRTLRQAIAWSYDLLTCEEQRLLRALAIFVGGCTFAAAEAVATAVGEADVFDGLGSLIDKSLLLLDASGSVPRYRMLETVREFALEELAASAEEELRRAHLSYLDVFSRETDLFDLFAGMAPSFEAPVARIAPEEGNVRAALEWAFALNPAVALGIAARLGPYWHAQRRATTGFDLLDRAQAAETEETAERALALAGSASLAISLGRFVRAEALADAAFSLASQLPEPRTAALARYCLGISSSFQGHRAKGAEELQDALARFEAIGNAAFSAASLNELGNNALDQGDAEAAISFYERCLAFDEGNQNDYGRALGLVNLAMCHRVLDHRGQARDLASQALGLAERTTDPYMKGIAALAGAVLGQLELERGDVLIAGALVSKSLELSWELADMWNVRYVMESAGKVMAAGGQSEAAARAFGAEEVLREAISSPLTVSQQAEHERELAAVRTALGEPSYTREWERGRRRPLAETVAEALGELRAIAEGHAVATAPAEAITSPS